MNHSTTNKENSAGADTTLTIPVVLDSAIYVNGLLSIKINNSILYKLFKAEEYVAYGFDKNPNRVLPNAQDIISAFMFFERELFGTTDFKINDNRVFDILWADSTQIPEYYIITIIQETRERNAHNKICYDKF